MEGNMVKFSVGICKTGEPLPGTTEILSTEELAALHNADVSVKDGPKIVGSAKLTWYSNLGALIANGEYAEGSVDPKVEVLALVDSKRPEKAVELSQRPESDQDTSLEDDPDYDPSSPHRILEIWYDLKNWWRYVKNESKIWVGTEEKWVAGYVGMDCCGEIELPDKLDEDQYEGKKRRARADHAFAMVKNVRNKAHIYAEDALLVAMQARHTGGEQRGAKVKPPKMEFEFTGDWGQA